ncbi:unnamed protein product [Mytilus edulis]|uniref:Fibrinogen C-terminal domain-containing protein n=1 Tax=Mytilus edulis TaxID=6550 RepID=A0A8S3SM70_MYTED|nr:unnamed protein product [Mytilus edulis]
MEIPNGQHHTANYTTFRVSDEQSLYVLTVTGYTGDAGQNAMDYPSDNYKANGKPFTTKDKDNDKYNGNLAVTQKSAWCERVCYSCSSMKETETCQHVMICNKDEICFVQKYFTLGNETRYDFGCTYQELCQKDITGHILGKRNEHAHIACQKCCNDSNICNNDRSCRNVITRQKCLSCDHVDNPKVCNNTMTCDKGELCLHGSNTNILGRRTSAGRHLTCERCCDGTELCNTDLQCPHQERNDLIHLISTNGRHELSIYMEIADTTHHTANYSTFKLSDEQSLYVLTATGYSGDTNYDCIDVADDNSRANGRPLQLKTGTMTFLL